MGLDMYLNAKHCTSGYNRDNPEYKEYAAVLAAANAAGFVDPNTPILTVSVTVAYWRKSNQIHAWFVQNCQGGADDCRGYYVEREQLAELKGVCEEVLANPEKAATLLPAQEGFFFGGTDYDDDYFADLLATVERLGHVLKNVPEGWDFEYEASW